MNIKLLRNSNHQWNDQITKSTTKQNNEVWKFLKLI